MIEYRIEYSGEQSLSLQEKCRVAKAIRLVASIRQEVSLIVIL